MIGNVGDWLISEFNVIVVSAVFCKAAIAFIIITTAVVVMLLVLRQLMLLQYSRLDDCCCFSLFCREKNNEVVRRRTTSVLSKRTKVAAVWVKKIYSESCQITRNKPIFQSVNSIWTCWDCSQFVGWLWPARRQISCAVHSKCARSRYRGSWDYTLNCTCTLIIANSCIGDRPTEDIYRKIRDIFVMMSHCRKYLRIVQISFMASQL